MDIELYLKRINFDGDAIPTLKVLLRLQKAHLLAVPFENIDIHLNRRIKLNVDTIYQKVVLEKRGGFCYELNGLFYELLKSIGFNVKIVSARVYDENSGFGKEFDHLCTIIHFAKVDYLADVGFGEFTMVPLKFEHGSEQQDENGVFKIEKSHEYYHVLKRVEGKWRSEYKFKLMSRKFSDFSAMCVYHQTSSKSHFTKGRFCTIATENGRITLSENKLKITNNNEVTKIPITEDMFDEYLLKYFKIKI